MEIFGLAIVVVILLVGVAFIIGFVIFKAPTDYRKTFVTKELAKNMVGTFLKINAFDAEDKCSQLSMTEILQACARDVTLSCKNCNSNPDPDVNSCDFVKSTAEFIFQKTLDEWKMKYEFLAYTDERSPEVVIGTPCRGQKMSSEPWHIPTGAGNTIAVKLDICV